MSALDEGRYTFLLKTNSNSFYGIRISKDKVNRFTRLKSGSLIRQGTFKSFKDYIGRNNVYNKTFRIGNIDLFEQISEDKIKYLGNENSYEE